MVASLNYQKGIKGRDGKAWVGRLWIAPFGWALKTNVGMKVIPPH